MPSPIRSIRRLLLSLAVASPLVIGTLNNSRVALAASTDPLPNPSMACASLTLANLQAAIDAISTDINGPATQDVNSVPSTSAVATAWLLAAQDERDLLISARDTLVKLRDTLVAPQLQTESFVTNASVAWSIHEYARSTIDALQRAEYWVLLSAVDNKTIPPRYSYLAMVQQLMPRVEKLGADGGACYISLYPPIA